MAILNFQLEVVGQSGVQPTFMFINTDDSVSTVTTEGYLNHFVAQNNAVSQYKMALVSTISSDVFALQLYNVVHSGTDWSLVIYPAGGGGSSTGHNLGSGTGLYVNNTGSVLNFNSLIAGQGIEFIPATGTVTIVNDLPFDPAIAHTVSGAWDFTNASIEMPGLGSATTANVVYWNNSTGLLTHGTFTAFDPSADYNFTGNDQFTGGFIVDATIGDVNISSSNNSVNILAPTAGKSVNLQSPSVVVIASTSFNSTAGASSFQTTGSGTLQLAAGGVLSMQGAGGIDLPSLASATTANILYWNSSTGFVTQGALPASGMSWNNSTSSPVTGVTQNGYTSNAGATNVHFSLPISSVIGDAFEIQGAAAGLFTITQAAGQQIFFGNMSTTAGAGGSLASTLQYDAITLRALTNTGASWSVVSSVGNFNLV